MTSWRRWLRLGTLLGATAGLWSCVAPILTVPPPGAVTFTPAVITDASGTPRTVWTTEGGPLEQAANAAYYVINRRLGSGVIATARSDGSFTAPPMEGVEKDPILINYRTPTGDYSDSTCVLLSAEPLLDSCP
ncbi:MAG TPA: hypothetical protein VHH90_03450 [Polyangia bacterium]|nr:hypothetical protein [Polyangia bacterium]